MVATGIMWRVDKISSQVSVDMTHTGALHWGDQGYGLTPEEYRKGLEAGRIIGHPVYREHVDMVSKRLGWEIDDYREPGPQPIISKSKRVAKYGSLEPGTVCGRTEEVHAFDHGRERFDFHDIYIMTPKPEEDGVDMKVTTFKIHGFPSIEIRLIDDQPGLTGIRTAAAVVNQIPGVVEARPGIATVVDLPPAYCLPSKPDVKV